MKLLVFDVDDTLVPPDKILPKTTIKSVNRFLDRGDTVAIASGRPFKGIDQYLSQFQAGRKYAISANGAAVYDFTGQLLATKELHYKDFLRFYHEHPEVLKAGGVIYCYTLDGVGCFDIVQTIEWECRFNNVLPHDLKKHPLNPADPILKFMVSASEEIINGLTLSEEDKRYHILKSDPHYLEFVNPLADKASGVEYLRNLLRLPKENVYCFGDEGNDYLMIKGYQGVAMGNGIAEVKKVAKFVTLPVGQDGVSYALKEFVH
jgi:hypothetical protein